MSPCTRIMDWLENETGVRLADKEYILTSRLPTLMEQYGLSSFDDLASRLASQQESALKLLVIDALTTHETRFFRDEGVFQAFAEQIVPEWRQRRKEEGMDPDTNLRIWCAGCSSGQEPYSIAMSLLECFPALATNVSILASDISDRSIDRARSGLFSSFEIRRGLPDSLKRKYFQPEGEDYRIAGRLRSMIEWSTLNLIQDAGPAPVDIIFCRNVAIYFGPNARSRTYATLIRSLKKDGTLILGTAESPPITAGKFLRREFGMSHYYEINMSKVTLFK